MAAMRMSLLEALRWIKLGLVNGNIDAAVRLLDDLIAQLEAADKEESGGSDRVL